MPVTDNSMGKKPRRNQNASSAARFVTLVSTDPCHIARINSRQLKPVSLRRAGMASLSALPCFPGKNKSRKFSVDNSRGYLLKKDRESMLRQPFHNPRGCLPDRMYASICSSVLPLVSGTSR